MVLATTDFTLTPLERDLPPPAKVACWQLSCAVLVQHQHLLLPTAATSLTTALTATAVWVQEDPHLKPGIGLDAASRSAPSLHWPDWQERELRPPLIHLPPPFIVIPDMEEGSGGKGELSEEEGEESEWESEWETDEGEDESSDSGLGSLDGGRRVVRAREAKEGVEEDRGPYDSTPLRPFSQVEQEVAGRCRDWVARITDPSTKVKCQCSLLYSLICFPAASCEARTAATHDRDAGQPPLLHLLLHTLCRSCRSCNRSLRHLG